jgi:metal-sulfur cluster biosynthetic enzyme
VTAPVLDTSGRLSRDPTAELTREVFAALETVRDPELDEPVTRLGFVASCTVSGGPVSREAAPDDPSRVDDVTVEVHLRLPTYFCAPNFAFLMVADAYDAVAAVPGVAHAVVRLDDHFAGDAINAGVAARSGFASSFEGEALGELDELRADFVRKAVMAGTDRVCRPLLAEGRRPEELGRLRLGDVAESPDLDHLRARRRELGLPASDDAPLLVDPVTGAAVGIDALPLHLRKARLTGVNQEANSGVCRGMLAARYPVGPSTSSPSTSSPSTYSPSTTWESTT